MRRSKTIKFKKNSGDIAKIRFQIGEGEKVGQLLISVYSRDHGGSDLLIQGFLDEKTAGRIFEAIHQGFNYGVFY